MVFRVGVPFAQIANDSLTRRPSSQGNAFVAKWHALEQIAESLVPYRGDRRLLDKHVNSMDGSKQEPASLAVGIIDLNILTESLQSGL